MKRNASYRIVLTTITLITGITLTALAEEADEAEFPVITKQPADDAIGIGSPVSFSVQANNGHSYQWLRNGVALHGKTNCTLNIDNVGTNDVGLYTCQVAKDGGEPVPTRTASLNVFTASYGGGPITIFGTPILSGGSQGTCPGPYIGYVNYIKTASQGWGWVPTAGTTVHTASDLNRTDTKVQYLGKTGDRDCAQTTVSVPDPTQSAKYRFTIYFTNNLPTNAYAITLDGFDP